MIPDSAGIMSTIEATAAFLADHPRFIVAAVVAVIVCLVVAKARRRVSTTDPIRMFTSDQRREGFARAGGRCEMPTLLGFMRCRRPAEHGDHFIPWSVGGATDMANFVAACAVCNLAKSSSFPSIALTAAIALRRRRYFPDALPRRPGHRYGA